MGDPDIDRKAEVARAGLRITAAGGGAYLAKLFGPAAAVTIAQVMAEVSEMVVGVLARWEERRIERTLRSFKEQVDNRTAAGDVLRQEIIDPGSQAAAELFESVVEAAARSVEEKKCDVIANLYASINFEKTISIEDALLYVRRIRASSWRQLVALRYFEDVDRARERELIGVAGAEGDARIHPAFGIELSELGGRGLELIGLGEKGGAVTDPVNTFGGGALTSKSVPMIRATGLGETISRLGRLAELVNEEELDRVRNDLQSDEREQGAT